MEGKIEKNRSVKFNLQVDTKLDNLTRKLGRTKRTLVIQMIEYIYSTKKDPIDINDHALRNQQSQGINRILPFIKQTASPMFGVSNLFFIAPIPLNQWQASIDLTLDFTLYQFLVCLKNQLLNYKQLFISELMGHSFRSMMGH